MAPKKYSKKRLTPKRKLKTTVTLTEPVVKEGSDSTKRSSKRQKTVVTSYEEAIDNDYIPPPKSITPSVSSYESPIRRRRKKVVTETKQFTQKEKKSFYECLQQKGFSCLNNDQLLLKTFPNRSMPEIKQFIDTYSRRAQELNHKNEETISGGNTDVSKQPIEKWFDLVHSLVPNPVKKDDISTIFVDFFEECPIESTPEVPNSESDEELEPNFKPNYPVIYETIRDILSGKYAKQMEPINAFFILKLIEELKQFIKSDNNRREMSFLKSGLWWQIPNQTNAQRNDDYIIRAVTALRQQQNDSQPSEVEPSVNGEEEFVGNDILTNDLMQQQNDETFENLRSFPKLRKIIECLNPLRVLTELIAEECKRWQRMG